MIEKQKTLDNSQLKTLDDIASSYCELECSLCNGGCNVCNTCYCDYCEMDNFVKYLADKVVVREIIK